MKLKTSFFKSLPFHYYLVTRYAYGYERVIFLLKYFGFYLVLLWSLDFPFGHEFIQKSILGLILFYNIYDYFSFQNDRGGIPDYRKDREPEVDLSSFSSWKFFWFLTLNLFFIFLFGAGSWAYMALLQVLLVFVFWLHNRAIFPLKIVTFIGLYILKIFIFALFIGFQFDILLYNFLLISLFFNLSYLPAYITRKGELSFSENNLLVQPIVWKNILLLVLLPFGYPILWVLLFTDIMTLIEFLIGKLTLIKRYDFKT